LGHKIMLVDLSDQLNETAFKELKKGNILIFNDHGVRRSFRIVRINKKSKKCFAEATQTYKSDEVNIVDKEEHEG